MNKQRDVYRGRSVWTKIDITNLDGSKETWESKIRERAAIVIQMLEKKHEDYGEDNLVDFGDFGILVRMTDKLKRVRKLIETGENNVGESLKKEWADLAGYALQALVLFHDIKNVEEIL